MFFLKNSNKNYGIIMRYISGRGVDTLSDVPGISKKNIVKRSKLLYLWGHNLSFFFLLLPPQKTKG